MSVRTGWRWPFGGLLTGLALLAFGCGTEDQLRPNQPPRVDFYGTPHEGDSTTYVVDFTWVGWDDDGRVVRSEYAVDIPDTFTPEQIDNPATPGITWTTTPERHARVRFRVGPVPPTGADAYSTESASAPHTFYVRVYDDDGAHSSVRERSFNAWTILPTTTITCPDVSLPSYSGVNRTLLVSFTAEDPDGPALDHRPLRTEYKLVPVPRVIGVYDPNQLVNERPGSQIPWQEVPDGGGLLSLTPAAGSYLLALRSVDEAGGVESRFSFQRNALLVSVGERIIDEGNQLLTVTEPRLGRVVFPNDGSVVDFEAVTGQCLALTLVDDGFGVGVVQYRACLDAPEGPFGPEDAPGCSEWGEAPRMPSICLDTPGTHVVDVAIRYFFTRCDGSVDTVESVRGALRFQVVPPVFDREVLYVDDYFKPVDSGVSTLTDRRIDQRYLDLLHAAGYTDIHSYDAWGADDLEGAVRPITLAELLRYRLVFWSVLGAGGGSQNANSALLQASSCATGRVLRAYLAAGGALWINGEVVFGALKDRNGNDGVCLGATNYNASQGLTFDSGSLVTDFLHISGGDFRDVKGNTQVDGLLQARPTAAALAEGFPTVEADSTAFAYEALGGLNLYDAQFGPASDLGAGVEALYTAGAVRNSSTFEGRPIAWRYADTGSASRQGPVVITAFPLHRMKPGAASRVENGVRVPGTGVAGLAEALATWFRAHDATQRTLRSVDGAPWPNTAVGARHGGSTTGE